MHKKRGAVILMAAFVAVLLGGAALAGVGALNSDGPGEASAPRLSAVDTTAATEAPDSDTPVTNGPVTTEAPAEDPADTKEQPKEEPEPKDELDIVILSPDQETVVQEPVVVVKGLTHPQAHVTLGRQEADMGADGLFWMRVELEPGRNKMIFRASLNGQHAEARLIVLYDDIVEKRFTAHQKWEVTDGNPTSNVYWGTGVEGSTISVRSEYGRGSTTVDAEGDWELRVRFEAPCNTPFAVKVSASTGGSKTFHMKRACRNEHEFTAHQKWEVTDGNPTSNIYWGTAAPQAEVWVGSEFGSGHTTANGEGDWELKVHFEAPCNQWFRVAAESGEARKSFEMKRACAEDHEFSANQKYGSCGEEVPYDVFWGTGVPGTKIHVESQYGGGQTTVNENGKWEIRVEFPEAPFGETFNVSIDGEGGEAVFNFTRTGGEGDH